jgi:hypothetical protein
MFWNSNLMIWFLFFFFLISFFLLDRKWRMPYFMVFSSFFKIKFYIWFKNILWPNSSDNMIRRH